MRRNKKGLERQINAYNAQVTKSNKELVLSKYSTPLHQNTLRKKEKGKKKKFNYQVFEIGTGERKTKGNNSWW